MQKNIANQLTIASVIMEHVERDEKIESTFVRCIGYIHVFPFYLEGSFTFVHCISAPLGLAIHLVGLLLTWYQARVHSFSASPSAICQPRRPPRPAPAACTVAHGPELRRLHRQPTPSCVPLARAAPRRTAHIRSLRGSRSRPQRPPCRRRPLARSRAARTRGLPPTSRAAPPLPTYALLPLLCFTSLPLARNLLCPPILSSVKKK